MCDQGSNPRLTMRGTVRREALNTVVSINLRGCTGLTVEPVMVAHRFLPRRYRLATES